jgi:biopolymer transport protein ExbB
MNRLPSLAAALVFAAPVLAQSQDDVHRVPFDQAHANLQKQLQQSTAELEQLRAKVAAEKIPLSQTLGELETELAGLRAAYQQKTRVLDGRALDLGNLLNEIKARQDESAYLTNLLGEYGRSFESRLHIAELQRYAEPLQAARLAAENSGLDQLAVFEAQAALVAASLDRLHDAVGGARFPGRAVDANGAVRTGTIVQFGPAAVFRSEDGTACGTVEQRIGSLEPAIVPFAAPEDGLAAAQVAATSAGQLPLDATLGNAHKVAAIEETLVEHIERGGPVMVPILAIAGLALLVALLKWLGLSRVRSPKPKDVTALLDAVARRDKHAAQRIAAALPGPGGRMLAAGVDHLEEPRELIEEVMYETVLATRLKLNRWLPFVAITASSAPLLGLLGTVTGIMNTFTLMTVFGTGDVKTLSSGISEALITTEFGLYVAIPALLLHAFLSRKARAVIDRMEKAGVAFVNQVGKTPFRQPQADPPRSERADTADPAEAPRHAPPNGSPTQSQLRDALADLLLPHVQKRVDDQRTRTA